MLKECRWNEDESSRRELDNQLQIPENKVAALGVIKVPNCKDRAYTRPQVEMVTMATGCHASNVEGTRSKDTMLTIKDPGEI